MAQFPGSRRGHRALPDYSEEGRVRYAAAQPRLQDRETQRSPLGDRLTSALNERTLEILASRQGVASRRRGWLVRRFLICADIVGLVAAFALAESILGNPPTPIDRISQPEEYLLFFATLPGWIGIAKLYGLYKRDEETTHHTTVDDLVGVFHIVTVGVWFLAIGALLTNLASPDVAKLAVFWGLAVTLVTGCRIVARGLSHRSIAYVQNTMIVGAGEIGQTIARKLLQHPEYGINLVGFVDSAPKERRPDLAHLTVLGSPEQLPEMVGPLDVERVIIAFSGDPHSKLVGLVRRLRELEVQIDIVPRLFEVLAPNAVVHSVEGLPLVSLPPRVRLSAASRVLKRTLDATASAVLLLLFSPLLLVVAALIKWDSPGPLFFRQLRVGEKGQSFRIFKFRTMVQDADARKTEFVHLNKHAATDPRMFKIPSDPRVTRIGAFLRRYSIDELPQLINVLLGDMSLVGPRPLILAEDKFVGSWARRRLDLKPGITGPWQVQGRSQIPFEEMVTLDYLYVTQWSLLGDLALLLRTIPVVLRGDATEASLPSFDPTKNNRAHISR